MLLCTLADRVRESNSSARSYSELKFEPPPLTKQVHVFLSRYLHLQPLEDHPLAREEYLESILDWLEYGFLTIPSTGVHGNFYITSLLKK